MELTKAFYSPGELAEILDLTSDTIINYIKAGKVFAIRLSERTYRIPQREMARVTGQRVSSPRINAHAHGGEAAAEKLRRRMGAPKRAAVAR